jgi:hypothetical protein
LDHHVEGFIALTADVGGLDAVVAEGGIQRPVRCVTEDREVGVCGLLRVGGPDHEDLPILLKGDAGRRLMAAEVGYDDAVAAETRVERSVGVEPGHDDVHATEGVMSTHHHDLAVRLDGHGFGFLTSLEAGPMKCPLPVAAEGGV